MTARERGVGTGCVWAALGAAVGLLGLVSLLVLSGLTRNARALAPAVPVLTSIPRLTDTPVLPTSVPPTATATPETPSTPDTSAFGQLRVGDLAEVYGTEGEGLRLRDGPSTGSKVNLLALEAEIFLVRDGPVEADGHQWLFLVSPSDSTREGWAVEDYLRPAQSR